MIRVLPPEVVNQIAAGEVIERPFSVVKELIENSLDAGALRVVLEIAEGGRQSIRITDDGVGFTANDLALAFASHATSKLSALADLDHIASLGFRGEALASIGSVARVTIRSTALVDGLRQDGHEVRCEGGKVEEVRPAACPPGSVIEVRDLFFNTPARRRFLKTERAEQARIKELLLRLSLARPDVGFEFLADGRPVFRATPGEPLLDRVRRVVGPQLGDGMLPVASGEIEVEGHRYLIEGFTVRPEAARRDSRYELLFVNGRLAKDSSSTYAIRQAYKGRLVHGLYPAYVLMLSLPPDQVDVNVHPSKAEVRFLEGRRVAGLLNRAVDRALGEAELGTTTSAKLGGATTSPRAVGLDRPAGATSRAAQPDAQAGFAFPSGLFGADSGSGIAESAGSTWRRTGSPRVVAGGTAAEGNSVAGSQRSEEDAAVASPHPFATLGDKAPRFLQVQSLYLVFEGATGLVVVDQHALHERVLYERFRNRHDAEPLAIQRLLTPEIVELESTDKAWLLDGQEALAAEGFLVEDFGGDDVAIHGVPAVLDRKSPRKTLELLLRGDSHTRVEGERDNRPSAREAIVERFHSMACRAAVMAGDRMNTAAIEDLLREAATLEHPHHCPHGRPTTLTFGSSDLERYFRRTV